MSSQGFRRVVWSPFFNQSLVASRQSDNATMKAGIYPISGREKFPLVSVRDLAVYTSRSEPLSWLYRCDVRMPSDWHFRFTYASCGVVGFVILGFFLYLETFAKASGVWMRTTPSTLVQSRDSVINDPGLVRLVLLRLAALAEKKGSSERCPTKNNHWTDGSWVICACRVVTVR